MFWDSDELKNTVEEIRKDVKEVLVTMSALIQQVRGIDESNKIWHEQRDRRCDDIEHRVYKVEKELNKAFAEADRIGSGVRAKESFLRGIWQAVVAIVALTASISVIVWNAIRQH